MSESTLTPSMRADMKRSQINELFFSCVIYETAEIERLLALPGWLRYIRTVFVWLFDWLSPVTRDRLGLL